MKRILFLGATTILVLLSCGDDRDEDYSQQNSINQKIVGVWTIIKKESNGKIVPTTFPCPNLGNFAFASDQKLFENHSSVVNNNCITDTDSYNYSIDESNKKITAKNAQNDVLVYGILSLSDNELVLVNTEGSDTTKYILNK